jgi:hypothetical protein
MSSRDTGDSWPEVSPGSGSWEGERALLTGGNQFETLGVMMAASKVFLFGREARFRHLIRALQSIRGGGLQGSRCYTEALL